MLVMAAEGNIVMRICVSVTLDGADLMRDMMVHSGCLYRRGLEECVLCGCNVVYVDSEIDISLLIDSGYGRLSDCASENSI